MNLVLVFIGSSFPFSFFPKRISNIRQKESLFNDILFHKLEIGGKEEESLSSLFLLFLLNSVHTQNWLKLKTKKSKNLQLFIEIY